MASKKKLLQAAAGSAGGAGLDVDEVFSTYLYDGTGSAQTITNNIDLSGEGGLVWIKDRDSASNSHMLYDTERGAYYAIKSNTTDANQFRSTGLTAFNSNGFTLGSLGAENSSGNSKASWTWRKAPKFFTCLTYTGTGTPQNISHSLNSTVGMIAVKRTDTTGNWAVYHRGANGGTDPEDYHAGFNLTDEFANNLGYWNDTAPTTTQFTVGDDSNVNANNGTYVAYLFAHNNNDGEFGPDGDADIIKCGSYTGTGSAGNSINLGFEPQWLLVKSATRAGQSWEIVDTMRRFTSGGVDERLRPNATDAGESSFNVLEPTPTGFKTGSAVTDEVNESGQTYIYMAIRRGPLAAPESATDVFAIDQAGQTSPTPPRQTSGFPVDFFFWKGHTGTQTWRLFDRLRGKVMLAPNSTDAETSNTYVGFAQDQSLGIGSSSDSATDEIMYMWRRAPSYFDCVCYDGGNGSSINHNLTVPPEMYWIKCRSDGSTNRGWAVYHKDATTQASKYLRLDTNDALISLGVFNNGTIDANTFSANNGYSIVNESGQTYIAYLFASLDGVSKVGSYTGSSSAQNIDCGFSSGARFVLIKCTNFAENWMLFDSVRGIVSGNDKALFLNLTSAEDGSADLIDPYSSGFTVAGGYSEVNSANREYIFYAIA